MSLFYAIPFDDVEDILVIVFLWDTYSIKTIASDFNIKSFPEHYQLYVPESAQVGSAVGKIKANDADTGSNADMIYSITNGDGIGIFSISTDKDTREGILSLKKVSK